jgi:hypothetical protein
MHFIMIRAFVALFDERAYTYEKVKVTARILQPPLVLETD